MCCVRVSARQSSEPHVIQPLLSYRGTVRYHIELRNIYLTYAQFLIGTNFDVRFSKFKKPFEKLIAANLMNTQFKIKIYLEKKKQTTTTFI